MRMPNTRTWAVEKSGAQTRPLQGLLLGPVHPADVPGHATRELVGAWFAPARGRWLHLTLVPFADHPPLQLVVQGTEGHWPDVSIPLRREGDAACGWVFVSTRARGLRIEGPMNAVEAIEHMRARIQDARPQGAPVSVAMLTAETLHRMGVRSMCEVTFCEDADWPLCATGHDPQLRFERMASPGRAHVELDLVTEQAGAGCPTIHWTDGRGGFMPDASAPLAVGPGPGRYRVGLPALRSGARWRLDPVDVPGRFRIDALRVQWMGGRSSWLGDARDALLSFRPTRGLDHLIPAADTRRLKGPGRRFLAAGDDVRMRLDAPLAGGWYMLELQMHLPSVRGRARVHLEETATAAPAQAFSLPLRSGQLAKRLLWLKRRAGLWLDLGAPSGEFTINHFKIQRLGSGFALSRMQAKLSNARRAIGSCETEPGSDTSPSEIEAQWTAYCNLFEPHHEGVLSYPEWIDSVERPDILPPAAQVQAIASWSFRPVVSIVTPTYDTPAALLRECLDSVLAQTYPHWQLCIADDASTRPEVRTLLLDYAAREPRIRICLRERNGHIAQASNSALDLAGGEFVAFLDHDDTLAPHALFAVVEALQRRPAAQIVYSDEDKLDGDGNRCDPYFKPDWSPDLLRSQNYVSHLGVYRRELVESVGRFRDGYQGSQDYDLLLRCAARVGDVGDVLHVPQILYHWRKTETSTATTHEQKPYATEAARRALQEHADMCSPGVRVSVVAPGLYRHRWPIPDPAPLVSLIVPTRDGGQVLRQCIDSIVQRTTYPHYEILVVDNQSNDPETLDWLASLPQRLHGRARVLRYDHPFNYAAINNYAASEARGSVLGLINDDVEVISPEWLTEMTSHAVRHEIGCVGAKLYYPDDTVQHAGVVLGIGGVAGHSHKYFDRSHDGYFSRLRIVHNVSAVTGAVLLVRKVVFDAVSGLDAEHLRVAFNDVDLCLKVQAAGWINVVTPFAELYHHESKTRGTDNTSEKRERFLRECQTMQSRWRDVLARDPSYNPNLTLVREDYSLSAERRSRRGRPLPSQLSLRTPS
jgi:glycosyltransferase involved in cell wall biosynthesis